MATLAELVVKIGVNAGELTKGLTASQKEVRKFGKEMSALGDSIKTGIAVGATAAAAGLGALVASGIKANANMEAYRNTLNTVMGDSEKAGQTLDWVKQYAAKTPFELPGLVESTVKLSAMGLEAEKFIPVAADMAAVFQSSGKTVQDASEAINDAMMGEFERLKEFGIKLGATDFAAGGKYAGKSYAEAVMEEVKNHNYTGAAEGLSNTFSGRLSTLKDTIGNFIQQATAPAFASLSASLGNLMNYISQLQANGTLDQWAVKATAALTTMGNVLVAVGSAAYDAARFIIDNWSLIEPIVTVAGSAFLAYKGYMLATQVATTAVTAAQWALNIAMTANPIGLVIAAIAALIAIIVLLVKNWDNIKAKTIEVWDAIKASTSATWDGIKNYLAEVWNNITSFAITKWDNFKTGFLGIWAAIVNGLKGYVNGVIRMVNKVIDALNTIQVEIPDWVPEIGGNTFGIDIPNVPYLAKGGIVTKPTLAVVGEAGPEAIVPLRGNRGGVGGSTFIFNITGANAKDIWDELKPELERTLIMAGV